MHAEIPANATHVQNSPRRLLSVNDVADALSIGRREVYRRLEEGDLESVWIGRRRLVPVESVDRYVMRLREEAATRTAGPDELRAAA